MDSKGLSNESIKVPHTGSNFLGPLLDYLGNEIRQNLVEVV